MPMLVFTEDLSSENIRIENCKKAISSFEIKFISNCNQSNENQDHCHKLNAFLLVHYHTLWWILKAPGLKSLGLYLRVFQDIMGVKYVQKNA